MSKELTQEYLKSIVKYSPESGVFIYLESDRKNTRRDSGDIAGWSGGQGYNYIMINCSQYKVNRLAWLYMTGDWPAKLVDHKNTNKGDDRWSNLREASHSQNQANRNIQKNNTSGFKGVNLTNDGKWEARVYFNKKKYYLGRFDDICDANNAVMAKREEVHGEFSNHG